MKIILTLFISGSLCFSVLHFFSASAQSVHPDYGDLSQENRPRLVVGIVIDQMRYEYITRFWDKFGEGGFKRVIGGGYNFANNHINYFPTATGPGHAAIYTGVSPSVNGIIENQWYNRKLRAVEYVVSDSTVQTVGASNESGRMSPHNLLSTTVTDELKTYVRGSRVISVAIKDRAAILPGGHVADGAYWYDSKTGRFVTSTWYRKTLPDWVRSFNDNGMAKKYSVSEWNTLLPLTEYYESDPDNSPYEGLFPGESEPVFPHKMGGYLSRIKWSPYGNTLLEKFAESAIEGEQLGLDPITDFLTISFSSTDYIGHKYGPHSVELEDTYLRLDANLAGLFSYLDKKVGKGNYLLFLTADHGACDVPQELVDRGLPGGYFDNKSVMDSVRKYLNEEYGTGEWVEEYLNQMIYLNRPLIKKHQISLEKMQRRIAQYLLKFRGVQSANTAYNFTFRDYNHTLQRMYQNGFYYERSGDVYIELKPGWLYTDPPVHRGASHGSPYDYDTHTPLVFYGWHIPHGVSERRTVVTQIAPTVCALLHLMFPGGSRDDILTFEK